MTIVSCLAGTITFFQYFWRGWILYRDDERRPIGGGKWGVSIDNAQVLPSRTDQCTSSTFSNGSILLVLFSYA